MTFGIDEDGRSDIPLLWSPRGADSDGAEPRRTEPGLQPTRMVRREARWWCSDLACVMRSRNERRLGERAARPGKCIRVTGVIKRPSSSPNDKTLWNVGPYLADAVKLSFLQHTNRDLCTCG